MAIKELKLDFVSKIKDTNFQVRRQMLSKVLEGELTASFKGKGIEFTGFRKYEYGDDASSIDWPATLRAKTPLIREYEEYRNFHIFVLLDVSNSMLFSSIEQLKCEYAAELAFSIVYSIVNTGNHIGMGLFTDRLVTRQIPQTGTANYFRMLEDLSNPDNYGGPFDFKRPMMQTKKLLTDKSLVIVISDFIGLKEGWHHYLSMMTENSDILGIMVRDPRDKELPKEAGQFLLEDPYTGEKLHIDSKDYADIFKKTVEEQEQEIKRKFLGAKGGVISVRTDEDFLKPLLKYVKLRAKQLAVME
ncbi:hypothetical protein CMO90_04055 [Candidatus Woesearchaeota archaeon]|jgi:uncharacterized protein (DUF58 family)|nr:hypothetical protein [Candidatus Woesearchaeota archaeon]|tara:strand:+ start:965 stop:1870 length:906 start_codon:yes stop_codon:yes gene_type:complete